MEETTQIIKDIDRRVETLERYSGGGSTGSTNLDGGTPTSTYGAIDTIDAGGV